MEYQSYEDCTPLTQAAVRAAFYSAVDRVTPRMPSPDETFKPIEGLSHEDVNAFIQEFTHFDFSYPQTYNVAQNYDISDAVNQIQTRIEQAIRDEQPKPPSVYNIPEFPRSPVMYPEVTVSSNGFSFSYTQSGNANPSALSYYAAGTHPAQVSSFREGRSLDSSHTESSFKVAQLLYPDIPPSHLGMDPITYHTVGLDFCHVAGCGERVPMQLSSLVTHIATCHKSTGAVRCNCGMWLDGRDPQSMAIHIHDQHLRADNAVCRSCKGVRNRKDFAIHLRLCTALQEYRQNRSEKGMVADLTPVVRPVLDLKTLAAEGDAAFLAKIEQQTSPRAKATKCCYKSNPPMSARQSKRAAAK
ncbi:hypothetical protein FB446DRAFT_845429 [Lentinula raphanica]|nr:hypothetical protein FB446DRAFT_845429 [Lentinula raphanica]